MEVLEAGVLCLLSLPLPSGEEINKNEHLCCLTCLYTYNLRFTGLYIATQIAQPSPVQRRRASIRFLSGQISTSLHTSNNAHLPGMH